MNIARTRGFPWAFLIVAAGLSGAAAGQEVAGSFSAIALTNPDWLTGPTRLEPVAPRSREFSNAGAQARAGVMADPTFAGEGFVGTGPRSPLGATVSGAAGAFRLRTVSLPAADAAPVTLSGTPSEAVHAASPERCRSDLNCVGANLPEPGTLPLVLSGLALLALVAARRVGL